MFSEWLHSSNYTVVFTGAGMSTESGLPDFRSRNKGLWNNLDPARLASTEALNKHVDDFIHFYRMRVAAITEYKPHKGHKILAKWEDTGKVKSIITQNVDGFHQEAGSRSVAELHGTLQKLHCQNCGKVYGKKAYLEERYECDCSGILRPSVVLFGETLPEEAFHFALQEAEKSDLFIVLGSSLSVTPANQLPLIAKENGARLVIINQEKTELDAYADQIIHSRKIGEVLEEVDQSMMN